MSRTVRANSVVTSTGSLLAPPSTFSRSLDQTRNRSYFAGRSGSSLTPIPTPIPKNRDCVYEEMVWLTDTKNGTSPKSAFHGTPSSLTSRILAGNRGFDVLQSNVPRTLSPSDPLSSSPRWRPASRGPNSSPALSTSWTGAPSTKRQDDEGTQILISVDNCSAGPWSAGPSGGIESKLTSSATRCRAPSSSSPMSISASEIHRSQTSEFPPVSSSESLGSESAAENKGNSSISRQTATENHLRTPIGDLSCGFSIDTQQPGDPTLITSWSSDQYVQDYRDDEFIGANSASIWYVSETSGGIKTAIDIRSDGDPENDACSPRTPS